MIDALLDPALNGADLGLALFAIVAAVVGERFDRTRNARRQAETEATK